MSRFGISENILRHHFIDWITACAIQSEATVVEFKAPQDHRAEIKFFNNWNVEQHLSHHNIRCDYGTIVLMTMGG